MTEQYKIPVNNIYWGKAPMAQLISSNKSQLFYALGESKSPPLDLMQSGQQILFNRQQNSAFSTSIGNNQHDQEPSSQPNPHASLVSTNMTTSNNEFTGLGNR